MDSPAQKWGHIVLRNNIDAIVVLSVDLSIDTDGDTIHFLLHTDRIIHARKSSNVDLFLYSISVFFNDRICLNIFLSKQIFEKLNMHETGNHGVEKQR